MKAKLVKTENGYGLEDVEIIAFYSSKRPEHKHYKLSKQNCDELFRVVDVEKLAKEKYHYYKTEMFTCFELDCKQEGFIEGANLILELNKDKVFTLENIDKAIEWATINGRKGDITHYDIDNFIQSLQQPTEIDVEITMETSIGIGDKYTPESKPLLDEEGCLILKKI